MQKFWNIFFLIAAIIFLVPTLWCASLGLPLTGISVFSVAIHSAWAMLSATRLFHGEGR